MIEELYEKVLKGIDRELDQLETARTNESVNHTVSRLEALNRTAMTLDDLRYRKFHSSGASSNAQEKSSPRKRGKKK